MKTKLKIPSEPCNHCIFSKPASLTISCLTFSGRHQRRDGVVGFVHRSPKTRTVYGVEESALKNTAHGSGSICAGENVDHGQSFQMPEGRLSTVWRHVPSRSSLLFDSPDSLGQQFVLGCGHESSVDEQMPTENCLLECLLRVDQSVLGWCGLAHHRLWHNGFLRVFSRRRDGIAKHERESEGPVDNHSLVDARWHSSNSLVVCGYEEMLLPET